MRAITTNASRRVDAPDPHSGPVMKDEKIHSLVATGDLIDLTNYLTADSLSLELKITSSLGSQSGRMYH